MPSSPVCLHSLLHDLHDHKYVSASPTATPDPCPITTLLLSHGAPGSLAETVQVVCENVSYSHEVANPQRAQAALIEHPELAIVQDADRLDALGAVGIGRAFTYGGAKGRPGEVSAGMQGTIEHFTEKLVRLESLMKVGTGSCAALDAKTPDPLHIRLT